jgi:hypothetical protein
VGFAFIETEMLCARLVRAEKSWRACARSAFWDWDWDFDLRIGRRGVCDGGERCGGRGEDVDFGGSGIGRGGREVNGVFVLEEFGRGWWDDVVAVIAVEAGCGCVPFGWSFSMP